MAWKRLTDKQWAAIRPHLPRLRAKPKGGRPRADDRRCLEGIFWILWSGSPWSALPPEYGSASTVHRRLCEWAENDVLLDLWRAFLKLLSDRQRIQWNECFVDGTFASAKKGANASVKPSGAREQSLWYWSMARVLRSEFTWRRLPQRR
jgi:transposase